MRKGSDAINVILASGGSTGALMRVTDWSTHPLGPPEGWCPELCSVLSICMNARYPIAIYWGADHLLLYNDEWKPILGDRHPWALGRPAHEVWAEAWSVLGPQFTRVFQYGDAITGFDERYFLTRRGYIEECYFDYTMSPIRGAQGEVIGIFNPGLETTQRVLSERRRGVLQSLAESTAGVRTLNQASDIAARALASGHADVSACFIYLLNEDRRSARLSAFAGIDNASAYAPEIDLDTLPVSVHAPAQPWLDAQRNLVIAPIFDPSRAKMHGLLMIGVSPRRPFDELYRAFVHLAAEGVGRAISVVQEHDREHMELRARLDKIASIAPVAIHEFRVAPDGTMSMPYSTPAIYDICGATPEQLAADVSRWIRNTNADDFERALVKFDEAKAAKKAVRTEWRVQHPDRGEIWVELRTTPEEQPDGTTVWYGYFHDVTERKKMEEALREREARFRQLAENIQEFFWLTDLTRHEFLYVSPAYEKIWGRGCASLQNCPSDWLNGIHKCDRERVARAASHQAEGTYDIEYRVVRPDGSVRFIHDRAFPIRDDQGSVYRIAGIAEDITAQKERESQIRFLAYHDALTGLPNRALLANRLRKAIAHAGHSQRALAVLFLDLDRFKTINDTLGHSAGDTLLQEVAERLTGALRLEDTVARAGGDEFLLLVSDLACVEDAALAAERVLDSLAPPFTLAEHTLRVTASIGISVCPRDANDVQSLIKYADAALYLAKDQGRNTFRYFSPELDAKVRARMHLENDLRGAVEREQFVLHYQPTIDVARRSVLGVEALIRWQHPERGLISPTDFIPVAEETGLILPIGEWALRTACTQARNWEESGLRELRVEVNISSRQLHGTDFVATVKRILKETGCNPRALGLEITESAAMTDPLEAIEIIRELHDMGIEIAIDDFGTGYSSLAYLKRFALDLLKIDSNFVHGLPGDRDDVAIVQAIIALGHQFRLRVVAEGVETPAQQAFLRNHHCDAVQGFLISRPLPAADIWPLLGGAERAAHNQMQAY